MKLQLYDCTNVLGFSSLALATFSADEVQALAGLIASFILGLTSVFSIAQKIAQFLKEHKNKKD